MITYKKLNNTICIFTRYYATQVVLPQDSLHKHDVIFPNVHSVLSTKKRDSVLHMNLNDFENLEHFVKNISNCFSNGRYSILVRVSYIQTSDSYSNTTEWKTLGNQIDFSFKSEKDIQDSVLILHKNINERLELSEETYNIQEGSIISIQFLIYGLQYTKDIVKKEDFSSLKEHKDLLNISDTKKSFNRIVPYDMNKDQYGIKLDKYIVDAEVKGVYLLDGSVINLVECINKHQHKNKISSFSNTIDFYLGNNESIITVDTTFLDGKLTNNIEVYDKHGIKIAYIQDVAINSTSFMRKISGVTLYIDKSGVYNKEIDIDLDYIKVPKYNKSLRNSTYPDIKTGCLDLETYYDRASNSSKIYAAGFCVADTTKTFYINAEHDNLKVLTDCLDYMLKEKYIGYTFYVHNLGHFDGVFILPALIKANEITPNKYKYKTIWRDDKILHLDISTRINNKTYSIRLVDSYNILASSLDKLCKTFNPSVTKGYFPYTFVNPDTLFYLGKKPPIKFYENISLDEYNSIQDNNWSMFEETTKYLIRDLESLNGVIEEFKRRIFIDYYTHITGSLTISGLALQIFLSKFYKSNIPLINKKSLYNDIKSSYYGGITEVYKPYGKNLYYYDVNSLYPYSAINPMPGMKCKYIENIKLNMKDCVDDMFGFYYCKIKTSNSYIGLLPVRSNTGITMPLGYIEGWYFSEELRFAYENGYDIEVVSGYKFNKEMGVFDDYIKEIFKVKSTSKDAITTSIAKSLLNNLLGRFGMSLDRTITEVMNEDTFKNIMQYAKIHNVKYIGDMMLVTYDSEISMDICESNKVDFAKTFVNISKYNNKSINKESFKNVSIPISSAVTSYSRIFMNKVKLDILNRGGNLYYTDTDSIVTDIKLPENMVGKGLGQFKLEHEVDEGFFISNKTYCLKTKEGKLVVKNKGVNDTGLSMDDFIKLHKGIDINTFRYESIRDYSMGSVVIKFKRDITIHADAYKKRSKVYVNNIWQDTKPLYIANKRNFHTTNLKYSKYSILRDNPNIWIFISLVFCYIIYGLSYFMSEYEDKSDYLSIENDDINFNEHSDTTYNTDKCITNTNDISNKMLIQKQEYSSSSYISNKVKEFFDLFSSTKYKIEPKKDMFKDIFLNKFDVTESNNSVTDKPDILNSLLLSQIKDLEFKLNEKDRTISMYKIKDLQDRIELIDHYNYLRSIQKEFEQISKTMKSPKL